MVRKLNNKIYFVGEITKGNPSEIGAGATVLDDEVIEGSFTIVPQERGNNLYILSDNKNLKDSLYNIAVVGSARSFYEFSGIHEWDDITAKLVPDNLKKIIQDSLRETNVSVFSSKGGVREFDLDLSNNPTYEQKVIEQSPYYNENSYFSWRSERWRNQIFEITFYDLQRSTDSRDKFMYLLRDFAQFPFHPIPGVYATIPEDYDDYARSKRNFSEKIEKDAKRRAEHYKRFFIEKEKEKNPERFNALVSPINLLRK